MQSNCLRLMGKKLLVSLAMEGKFCREGLPALEEDDDMLTAMARELVMEKGVESPRPLSGGSFRESTGDSSPLSLDQSQLQSSRAHR
jgi:hypothetical protein